MKIGALVKEYRYRHKLSMQEFADLSGLSKSYISMLERGRHPQNNREIVPSIETVQKIAIAMGLTVDELLESVDNNQLIDISHKEPTATNFPTNAILPSAHALPIMGTICAGDGVVCEDDFRGTFILDAKIRADYCLTVHGDSMIGAQIYDGDTVFISKDFHFEDGQIYAVERLDTGEASLKKVSADGDMLVLTPCNPSYGIAVKDCSEVRIAGKCVGVFHAY